MRSNSQLTDRYTIEDGPVIYDAPETPAPVFAVRALKSAIFGTPQEPRQISVVRRKDDVAKVNKVPKFDRKINTQGWYPGLSFFTGK